MPAQDTERNLLFGILALQNNFIDREALLEAFAAWIVDKNRPLGEILCEQGKLSVPQEEWLRGLMEQHVILHRGDPEQSLAAVSTIGSIREDLRKLGDSQLEATLDFVARARSEPDIRSTSGKPVAAGQRFRVIRTHAKGGLGEVFVAEDLELRREVALKEIQSRHADHPASRARFLLEAEITGGLEHPGIVPVYGKGQYADGRPFYAMRFIRGDSLKQAIDFFHKADVPGQDPGKRTLELRKLLGRFIDVCEAMEYAHSRGILHRDLKPGNIMLGRYGETLVVDWGLAKAVDGNAEWSSDVTDGNLRLSAGSDSEPTEMGTAIGTPAYMSPEQAAGQLELLGPASDVYGLGATLYQLLTGQTPVTGQDKSEVLRKVQQGNIPSPRARNAQVQPALSAICQKAMSLRQSERYSSPKLLAEDIERWLADEPVSCYAEPLSIRTRRWMKRHRTLVTSSAAAMVVFVLSLTVLLIVVAGHNRTLDAKNLALDSANSKLAQSNKDLKKANLAERAATQLAKENEQRSEQNASAAREQSHLVLKSLDSVLFDIQGKLKGVPGAGELRQSLIRNVLARLREVSNRFASRATVDRMTAVGLQELGDVYLRFSAESRGEDPREDSLVAANKLYEQALHIDQQLVSVAPEDSQCQLDLSVVWSRLGDVSLQKGNVQEALGHYKEALKIVQHLAAKKGADAVRFKRSLLVALNRLGDVRLREGNVQDALGYFQQGLEIGQGLLTENPTDDQAQRDLAVSYEKLGDLCLEMGRVQEALGYCKQSLDFCQKAAIKNPSDSQAQRDLWVAHCKYGAANVLAGQLQDARGHYENGLEISQKLAEEDPGNMQSQRDLAISHSKLGEIELKSGHKTAALEHFRHGFDIHQKLALANPSDLDAQRSLSTAHERLGSFHLQSGQTTEATEQYQAALKISEDLAKVDPSDTDAQIDLAISSFRLGNVEQARRQHANAIECYARAITVLSQLDRVGKLPPPLKSHLPTMQQTMQKCQLESIALGDWKLLLEQPADVLPALLVFRAQEFVRENRTSDALLAVARLRELGTATADQLYNAACVYSLCAAAIKAKKDELTVEQSAAQKQHIADALKTLREAIKAGYNDFAHMQKDSDLALLRHLPEFQELIKPK